VSSAYIFKVEFAGRHAVTARLSRRTCKKSLSALYLILRAQNLRISFT
jgi:hypothetical protein